MTSFYSTKSHQAGFVLRVFLAKEDKKNVIQNETKQKIIVAKQKSAPAILY